MNLTPAALSLALLTPAVAFGQFGLPQVVASSTAPGNFAVTDWDGDGDLDVACTDLSTREVFAVTNLGGGAFSAPQPLAVLGDEARAVEFADLDGDGVLDLVLGTALDLYWMRGLGAGSFGAPIPVLPQPARATVLAAGDLDGDGNLDLVTGVGSFGVTVHLGDGAGSYTSGPPLPLPPAPLFDLHLMDWDGDAHLDLIVGFEGDDWWVEVPAGGPTVTLLGLTDSEFFGSGDMDGDGDQDLARTSYLTGELGWYENLGGGVVGPLRTSPGILPAISSPAVIDVDGDGDLDLVAGGDLLGELVWVQNLGVGSLGPHQVISVGVIGVSTVLTLDLDNDGAPDVVCNAQIATEVQWFRNLHTIGTFVCPGAPNSVSNGATLVARGSAASQANRVTLRVASAPPHRFAHMLNSRNPGSTTPAGSMGTLCLAAPQGRYWRPGEIFELDALGSAFFALDLRDTPTAAGPVAIVAGETWLFQTWYRDRNPGDTSNFTDAISIQFR